MSDRDGDGIPDAEQITLDELDAIDRHIGEGLIKALADPSVRAPGDGRQSDKDFDPEELEYVGTMRIQILRSRKTNIRYQVNFTRLVSEKKIEIRAGHSIEGGVQGGRAQAFSTASLTRLGSFGPLLDAFLTIGGGAPAILANAAIGLLKSKVKSPAANAIIDQLLGRRALLAIAFALSLVWPAFAGALVLDHDMLTALVRSKEPEARIGYTPERLEFRTRRSALVGWLDVLLTAKFERHGKRVQLIGQALRVGPVEQRGKRFDEAKAGLLKLVDVETQADRVEVYRAGERVYLQILDPEAR